METTGGSDQGSELLGGQLAGCFGVRGDVDFFDEQSPGKQVKAFIGAFMAVFRGGIQEKQPASGPQMTKNGLFLAFPDVRPHKCHNFWETGLVGIEG